MTSHNLVCCCNSANCSSVNQIHSLIKALESDVYEAGLLGQQLLERYETHILTSEAERKRLSNKMELLERDKIALETANAQIINENRALLDHLEQLNQEVVDSDSHATAISCTLDSTRQELQQLSTLVQKANYMEAELALLETERESLQSEIATCQDEKQFITQRWRKAETTVKALQEQLEQMEYEASAERQEHKEAMSNVKGQISSRGSQKTGATALEAAVLGVDGSQSGPLSHFVRDILQDNSKLQVNILELKELLVASHGEIKSLRSQLDMRRNPDEISRLYSHSLQAEIRSSVPSDYGLSLPSEHYIRHHHYHTKWDRSRSPRRLLPSLVCEQLPLDVPLASSDLECHKIAVDTSQSAFGSASEANVSFPRGHSAKWSMHSNVTESSYCASTLSSSPYKVPSIFDSLEAVLGSNTTTPINSVPGSPRLTTRTYKTQQDSIKIGKCTDSMRQTEPSWTQLGIAHSSPRTSDVLELHRKPEECSEQQASACQPAFLPLSIPPLGTSLRRGRSHDSILALPSTDIPGLNRWNNTLYTRFEKSVAPAYPIRGPAASTAVLTTANVLSSTQHMKSPGDKRLTKLLEHVNSLEKQNDEPFSMKKVGHWVLGRWVIAPSLPATTANVTSDTKQREFVGSKPDQPFRLPGINQPGPIYGVSRPQVLPSRVQPESIDSLLLMQTLQED